MPFSPLKRLAEQRDTESAAMTPARFTRPRWAPASQGLSVHAYASYPRRVAVDVGQAPSSSNLRWWFAIVLVIVAGAVAAFAIYVWGWRSSGSSVGKERARARVFARELFCAGSRCGAYSDRKLTRL